MITLNRILIISLVAVVLAVVIQAVLPIAIVGLVLYSLYYSAKHPARRNHYHH